MNTQSAAPLIGFKVINYWKNFGDVVFARDKDGAIREGARRSFGAPKALVALRAEYADAYAAAGRVPAVVKIAHDWAIVDCYTGRRITEWYLKDLGLSFNDVVEDDQGRVFACADHQARFNEAAKRERRAAAIALDGLRQVVARNFPEARIVSGPRSTKWRSTLIDGMYLSTYVHVLFSLPGLSQPVQMTVTSPQMLPIAYIAKDDMDAFRAYEARNVDNHTNVATDIRIGFYEVVR